MKYESQSLSSLKENFDTTIKQLELISFTNHDLVTPIEKCKIIFDDLFDKCSTLIPHIIDPKEDIAIIWGYEDVIGRAEEMDYKIPTKEEAIDILSVMKHKHDCTLGITWETIDYYLAEFGKNI